MKIHPEFSVFILFTKIHTAIIGGQTVPASTVMWI